MAQNPELADPLRNDANRMARDLKPRKMASPDKCPISARFCYFALAWHRQTTGAAITEESTTLEDERSRFFPLDLESVSDFGFEMWRSEAESEAMIDLERYREQIFRLTNDWDVEVMESTDQELRELYEQVASLAKGGEENLGARDYNELHVAQILEVMIRWELHLRSTGEELPGVPYDPARTAARERLHRAIRRAWGEAN